MNPPQEPAQPRIWQLALGFATTAVLSALVKAGVIEQLGEQGTDLRAERRRPLSHPAFRRGD